jgi:hypothetical protein
VRDGRWQPVGSPGIVLRRGRLSPDPSSICTPLRSPPDAGACFSSVLGVEDTAGRPPGGQLQVRHGGGVVPAGDDLTNINMRLRRLPTSATVW